MVLRVSFEATDTCLDWLHIEHACSPVERHIANSVTQFYRGLIIQYLPAGPEKKFRGSICYLCGPRAQAYGDVFAIDLGELKPENDKSTEFSDYLVDNYVDEDSSFPPKIWAEMTSSAQRSTNACESFYSKYNSNFSSTHPHIYKLLDVLKTMQLDTVSVCNCLKTSINTNIFGCGEKNDLLNFAWNDSHAFVVL
ncbi:hypothetical protein QTP88_028185 [Uroleucon formosanum]